VAKFDKYDLKLGTEERLKLLEQDLKSLEEDFVLNGEKVQDLS
jgi:hypothetical protein